MNFDEKVIMAPINGKNNQILLLHVFNAPKYTDTLPATIYFV